jgi:predicted alpha/beta superfamily hydrolase
MLTKRKCVWFFLTLLGVIKPAFAEEFPAYSYPGSEVRSIHAESNNKDYELYIQLPGSYKQSSKSYPLVLVNDSRFAFPTASGAIQLMGGQVIQEAILVGISYSKGDDIGVSRTRDYTPTFSPLEKNGHSTTSRLASGHAKEYVEFIEKQVMPLLENNYRIDAKQKIFVGHSFGGLLGTYILFKKPELFTHYIIGSPSLWYDQRVIFKLEDAYAKSTKKLPAFVAMFVGSLETTRNPMVEDLLKLEKQMRARNYEGLTLQVDVLNDENHESVFAGLLSRGLRAAIPLKK